MVTWLIGLSGAGKTTVGNALYRLIKARKPNVIFLDGDHLREIMDNDLGHTMEDRRKNAARISKLCRFLDIQGIDVVCAVLSNFHEWQAWNRAHFSHYFEVYIQVAMDTLITRDRRGLYKKAQAGEIKNVVGVDLPFHPPLNPDLIVNNDHASVDTLAQLILSRLPQ